MIIRQAQESDLPPLAILFDEYRQFYRSGAQVGQSYQFLRQRFAHSQTVIFVQIKDDALTGFILLYLSFSSIECQHYYILEDLYITPKYRRQGCAQQLIDTVILFAQEQKALRISLNTQKQNMQAKRLYERLGFSQDTKFDTYHYVMH